MLIMQRWQTEALGPGDLTLVDVNSGATVVLGTSILDNALVEDPGAGQDRLAPGTHVAFVLENRIASPYDGIWVAALP